MPGSRLKHALQSHQAEARHAELAKRRGQNAESKAQSVKASTSGLKKAQKKARLAARFPKTAAVAATVCGETSAIGTVMEVPVEEVAAPLKQDKGKAKAIIPLSPDDTILLLGEANFSFAASLITHHRHPPYQILATSYDSEKVCFEKYPDAQANVERLRERGAMVEFGVDGGALEKCKKVGKAKWSRVIMNFPHTGSGIKDQDRNIRDNQLLLLRVLRSVRPVLTEGPERLLPGSHSGKALNKKRKKKDDEDEDDAPAAEVTDEEEDPEDMYFSGDEYGNAHVISTSTNEFTPPKKPGTVLITLLDQPPYSLWSLRALAIRPPHVCPGTKLPQPKYRLLRSFKFDPAAYPGYAHRRTLGFKGGVSKSGNEEILGRKGEARTWEFAPPAKVGR